MPPLAGFSKECGYEKALLAGALPFGALLGILALLATELRCTSHNIENLGKYLCTLITREKPYTISMHALSLDKHGNIHFLIT